MSKLRFKANHDARRKLINPVFEEAKTPVGHYALRAYGGTQVVALEVNEIEVGRGTYHQMVDAAQADYEDAMVEYTERKRYQMELYKACLAALAPTDMIPQAAAKRARELMEAATADRAIELAEDDERVAVLLSK